jgi:hypothetical protein
MQRRIAWRQWRGSPRGAPYFMSFLIRRSHGNCGARARAGPPLGAFRWSRVIAAHRIGIVARLLGPRLSGRLPRPDTGQLPGVERIHRPRDCLGTAGVAVLSMACRGVSLGNDGRPLQPDVLSLPITRRAPGYRAGIHRITRPTESPRRLPISRSPKGVLPRTSSGLKHALEPRRGCSTGRCGAERCAPNFNSRPIVVAATT